MFSEKKQSEDNSSLRVEPEGQSEEDQLDGPPTKEESSAGRIICGSFFITSLVRECFVFL